MAGSDWLKSETIRFLNQFALITAEFLFFLFLYFIKGEKASAIDIAPKIDGFERPYFVLFH